MRTLSLTARIRVTLVAAELVQFALALAGGAHVIRGSALVMILLIAGVLAGSPVAWVCLAAAEGLGAILVIGLAHPITLHGVLYGLSGFVVLAVLFSPPMRGSLHTGRWWRRSHVRA